MAIPGKDPRLRPYGDGNLGTPLELVDDVVVPTALFFVRSNGPIPEIDPAAWNLTVDGAVDRPLALTLDELMALPRRTVTAFLECAGNGRTRFQPVPEGTPWRNDAVGNATWTGTSLAMVLDRAGVRAGAVDVVAQGADFAGMRRGLPIAVARDPDTLLVWAMNGEPLTVPHGAPVRLLVPGWAGIAATKWLTRLTVLDHPFDGFYNTDNYVMISPAGEPLQPVREMPVKSLIARPIDGEALAAGAQTVRGFAWSGFAPVRSVEVSTDGGATWQEADISERAGRYAWVRFSHRWEATPGETVLMARATDERRLRQPAVPAWNLRGYQMNGIHVVTVRVIGGTSAPPP